MQELENKVAVVTGAASGIGRGLARHWAAAGMNVVLADIEVDPLNEVASELADGGAEVLSVPTDVSDGAAVDALAAATYERFGAAHIVCNNAGVGGGGPMWELTEADWEWVLGVNLWGVIHGIRAFVPGLVEQGEGHVVNTASVAGLTSPPGLGPYNASKHAVVTISETLEAELVQAGAAVGVTVICPGWVNTRIWESERNRPAHPSVVGDETGPVGDAADMSELGIADVAAFFADALDPAELAAQVGEAVRTNDLYVLTHDDLSPVVAQRAKRILAATEAASDS